MPTREPTRDQELLARAIRASGLTPRQYAKRVLIRDPRMIRRWLAGQFQLPKEVRAYLERLEQSRLEKWDTTPRRLEHTTSELTSDEHWRLRQLQAYNSQLGPISEKTAEEAISVLRAQNGQLGQEPTSQPPKPWWHYWSGKAD